MTARLRRNTNMVLSPLTLLYADNALIGLRELEKLTQAIVLYADKIWINAQLQVDPALPDSTAADITSKVAALVEAGFLGVWEYPIPRPQMPPGAIGHLADKKRRREIPSERYDVIHDAIRTKIVEYSYRIDKLAPDTGVNSPPRSPKSVDGLSELVHLRNNLSAVLIADELGASSLIIDRPRLSSFQHEFEHYYRDVVEANKIAEIFDGFARWRSLTGMVYLDVQDIVDLRNGFPQFRQFVLGKVQPEAIRLGDLQLMSESLQAVQQAFVSDLQSELRRRVPGWRQLVSGQLRTASLAILGFLFAPLSALSAADQLLSWRSGRQRRTPHVFYVMELEEKLRLKRNPTAGHSTLRR